MNFPFLLDPKKWKKINYPISLLSILCPSIYLFVLIKIKLFKKKIENIEKVSHNLPNHSKPLPSTLGTIFSTALADLTTVAVGLLFVVPVMLLALYLGTKDIQYLRNNQHLVYIHFHGFPFILCGTTAFYYLLSNIRMRETILREMKKKVFFKVKLIVIKIVINCFLKTKLQYYN
jgi:hypothetical protein